MGKIFFVCLIAPLFAHVLPASAQDTQSSSQESGVTRQSVASIRDTSQPVFVTLALGPAFTTGLESDSLLYNLLGAVNYNYTESVSGKVFGDIAMGAATDSARFMNFGAGADYYPMQRRMGRASPYVTADAGFGLTRTADDVTENALALGLGGGFRFSTQNANWDINLHYTGLTAQNEGSVPSMLGLRGGMNF